MQKTICLLPGDGIGPEIVAEAVKVLRAVEKKFGHSFTMTEALLGGAAIDAVGVPLPDATVEACKPSDCSPTCVPRPCSPNLPARACCVPTFPPRALISLSCAN